MAESYFTGEIEIDNNILIDILEQCKLYTGTVRKTMLKKGRGVFPTKNQISATWGLTRRGQLYPTTNFREESPYYGWYYTKSYSDNPHLESVFKEYSDLHLPPRDKFFWSQVQINKNFFTPAHKDSANQGNSIIVGLGAYTGGELAINKNGKVKLNDIRNKPLKFNGSKYTHWTEPFKGERWSLVFYTHHSRSELKRLIKKNESEEDKHYKELEKKKTEAMQEILKNKDIE